MSSGTTELAPTRDLARWSSALAASQVSDSAMTWAKHALLDWFGVTIAGSREELAPLLLEEFGGTEGPVTLVALNARAKAHDAALINGTLSHALDYDDVNADMGGHPTAPVGAAALALGEALGKSGRDVLLAFIAGYEVECQIGAMAGQSHYQKGFHATGTFGTFGATAAAARLMGLDAQQTAIAFGIAASEAAGLKYNFGTMTKPLHVGKAAMNGVIAARLAARGFTARDDAIEGPQGFAYTQVPEFVPRAVRPDTSAPFEVEANLFKYHAACYLTHSTIEAIRDLKRRHNIGLGDVEKITLKVDPGHLKVCDIPEPKTGLEIKFSIRHLAAMALGGEDTAALGTYSDEMANRPVYREGSRRVTLDTKPLPQEHRHGAAVAIVLKDGRELLAETNVGIPAKDVAAQGEKLRAKFHSLAEPVLGRARTGEAARMIERFETLDSLKPLMASVA
ncbi:MAG TPA: MmgE/PrpD family protein [Hyphomicrobiaceae bacterium]|nr:MmgE/PrpD family protein [Hyphomicrobiaceae bacterium]